MYVHARARREDRESHIEPRFYSRVSPPQHTTGLVHGQSVTYTFAYLPTVYVPKPHLTLRREGHVTFAATRSRIPGAGCTLT